MIKRLFIAVALGALAQAATMAAAREVNVKYRGTVNVDRMECQTVDRSSLVYEVCYHAPTGYMLISLKGTFYHYCAVDTDTFEKLMNASSMGRYYNAAIKGRYDCRVYGVPDVG